ncbi:hypothetical protein [Subtercola vilae]|uniref:Uncharacterized protein n=1 Tax=Subtercola vilae TaxID=2056433 RepID=A0A4T2BHN7_9MICO|nr:hypothetical protein [Subtercola vilae]TIH28608.1 hypothetical protein D4765_18435 [Subtercola vilae]
MSTSGNKPPFFLPTMKVSGKHRARLAAESIKLHSHLDSNRRSLTKEQREEVDESLKWLKIGLRHASGRWVGSPIQPTTEQDVFAKAADLAASVDQLISRQTEEIEVAQNGILQR